MKKIYKTNEILDIGWMRRLSEYRRAAIPVIGRFNTKSHEMERETKSSYININLVFAWTLEKILAVTYHINSLRAARCSNSFLILTNFPKNQISFLERIFLTPSNTFLESIFSRICPFHFVPRNYFFLTGVPFKAARKSWPF